MKVGDQVEVTGGTYRGRGGYVVGSPGRAFNGWTVRVVSPNGPSYGYTCGCSYCLAWGEAAAIARGYFGTGE